MEGAMSVMMNLDLLTANWFFRIGNNDFLVVKVDFLIRNEHFQTV